MTITDSKVFSGVKFLLGMLQSEASFILDGIHSLICPTIIDHLIYATKSVLSWSQNSEPVSARCLGRKLAWVGVRMVVEGMGEGGNKS